MAALELTQHTFEKTIDDNAIVLIDFWAPWCGPCRNFAPVFEAASARHPDALFAKVNTDVEQSLAAMFEIQSIPTLAIFREQICVFAQPGALPAAALEEIIGRVKALDMDEVRRRIAEHEGQAGEEDASGE
ncbi:MAG TPA: thioredoxin domain-containing protein [Myxococcota bacterium]|nr:thioredoxin domain-containing protein [Myxococcota bacterium]